MRKYFLWCAVLSGIVMLNPVSQNVTGFVSYAMSNENGEIMDAGMPEIEADSEMADSGNPEADDENNGSDGLEVDAEKRNSDGQEVGTENLNENGSEAEYPDSGDAETDRDTEDYSRQDADSAVRAFIDAAKRADIVELMDLFAVSEYVDHYQADSPDAEYFTQPVLEDRELEAAAQIMGFYTGLHMMHDMYENTDAFMDEFMEWMENVSPEELLDSGKYDTLEILRIDLPESDAQLHSDRIGNESLAMRVYGAEGWDYRTALLSFQDEMYYCGFGFVLYDGEYKIDMLRCPILTQSWGMTTFPCTEEEYELTIAD